MKENLQRDRSYFRARAFASCVEIRKENVRLIPRGKRTFENHFVVNVVRQNPLKFHLVDFIIGLLSFTSKAPFRENMPLSCEV